MIQQENKIKESIFKNLDIFKKNFNSTIMQIIVFILIFHIYKEWDLEEIKKLNISFAFFLKNFMVCHFQMILLEKFLHKVKSTKNASSIDFSTSPVDALYEQVQQKLLNNNEIKEQMFNELKSEYQQILKEDTDKLILEFISKTFQNHLNNKFVGKLNEDSENSKKDVSEEPSFDE